MRPYLQVMTLYRGSGYFEDYKENPEKRFVTFAKEAGLNHENFWDHYRVIYTQMKEEGLLLKSKHVEEDRVIITQVWLGRKYHDEFQYKIDSYRFYDGLEDIDFDITCKFIEEKEIPEIILGLIEKEAILQFVNDKYTFKGMVVGDHLRPLEQPRTI